LLKKKTNKIVLLQLSNFYNDKQKRNDFKVSVWKSLKGKHLLNQELQRLQNLFDAAKDSVDLDVNSAAVTKKAKYEMILPHFKLPQYLSVPELKTKIVKLEEQAQGMDIGKERITVLQKCNELKQYLDREALDQSMTHLQLALEQPLPDDIRRSLTCPISGDIMQDPVILFPSGKTFNRQSLCTWLLRNPMPRCPDALG
jgi:hypothetical protein